MKKNAPNALIYCEKGFNTTQGKTAHGLLRFSERFAIQSVIDSRYAGRDSGSVLDGRPNGIPVQGSVGNALEEAARRKIRIDNFIMGLAPDGGKCPPAARAAVKEALGFKMHIYSGLHDFLSEDPELAGLAEDNQCEMVDIRKPPDRSKLHFFSGKVSKVECLKIALLGTDSAVGKRTTAWILVNALREEGYQAEMIGTGQTAWLQGAKYSIILDSLVNDFVAGEIENAVYEAWRNESPDVIILEGQGSLLNPAYPGGFELLAAGRPDMVILQHAPRRKDYDGFPGSRIHPLNHQVLAIEVISGKMVSAITLNHEGILRSEIAQECKKIEEVTGIRTFDVLEQGPSELVNLIKKSIRI